MLRGPFEDRVAVLALAYKDPGMVLCDVSGASFGTMLLFSGRVGLRLLSFLSLVDMGSLAEVSLHSFSVPLLFGTIASWLKARRAPSVEFHRGSRRPVLVG